MFSQNVHHWESLIQTGDSCKYFVPNSDIGTQWIQKNSNDSTWLKGAGSIGFGDHQNRTNTYSILSSLYGIQSSMITPKK